MLGKLLALSLLFLAPILQGDRMEQKQAKARDMQFSWSIQGDVLQGTMRAKTRGWLAVGFNKNSGLKGARLIMASLHKNKARVEEHVVDPPRHWFKEGSTVRLISAEEKGYHTQVKFSLPLEHFREGEEIELILAFSDYDDFDHHSAMREHQTIKL